MDQQERFQVSKMKKTITKKGQSLIEVVMALVIVSLLTAGLVRVVIVSLKNMEFSRNQNFSLNLAQAKAEELRAERDSSNWQVFWEKYHQASFQDQEGIFTRTTSFEGEDDNKMKIIVNVSWGDSLGEHVSSISSYLTRWR